MFFRAECEEPLKLKFSLAGFRLTPITGCHPQSDDMVEKQHRQLTDALMAVYNPLIPGIWKTSVNQVCTMKDDRIIEFVYVPVDMMCYFVTKRGSIYSLKEGENLLLEIVSVDLMLAAAAWSPDSVLLALAEHLLAPVSQANTGAVICWDSLGECIAVSVFSPARGRSVHIWNSKLVHLRSLEYSPSIGLPICWRPSGGRIVCCEFSHEDSPTIIIFEEKGLKHHQFSLPKFFTGFEVCFMAWSSQSDVLALHLRSQANDADYVLLYTICNYHWYLKKTLCFVAPKSVTCLKWEAEQPRSLHIVFNDWSCLHLDVIWSTCRKNSTVAVLDEDTVFFTNFSNGVTPPPMYQASIKLDFFVNEVTFGHNEDELYALLSNHMICCISRERDSEIYTTVNLENDTLSENPFWYNLSYVDQHHLLLLLNDRSALFLVVLEVDWATCTVQAKCMHPLPWLSVKVWTFYRASEVLIFLQTATGSILKFTLPDLLNNELDLSQVFHCGSASYCSQVEMLECFNKVHLISLNEFSKLYVDEHLLCSTVTSFMVHCDEYLLFTTISHKLCVIPIKRVVQKRFKYDDEILSATGNILSDYRPVERGSRIVTSFGTSVVFQLPRGNLETVHPLPLLLRSTCDKLDQCDFRKAMLLMRKHSLDMNLVYDYNPDSFQKNVRQFIRQCGNEYLNLFISQLCPANVVCSLYEFYFGKSDSHPVSSALPICNSTKNITAIFRLMLDEIQALPERNSFLLVALLLHIKLEEAEKGLLFLKEHCHEKSKSCSFADGIRHMLYFMSSEELFNAALGTYDLDLVQKVAQSVDRDPKEYLPILNALEPLERDYRKYKIDCILKRPISALKNLALCRLDHFEEVLNHIERHSLYAQAIIMYKDQPEQLMVIQSKFAEFLESRKQFSDAGIHYERCDRFDDALRCYKQSLTWHPAWTLMTTKMKLTEGQIDEVADFFVKRLCEMSRYATACDILRQIGKKQDMLAEILIQGCFWMNAFYQVNSLDDDHPLTQMLRTKVISTAQRIIEEANKQMEDLAACSDRLNVIRQEKLDRQGDFCGYAYEDIALLDRLSDLVLGIERRQEEVAELLRVLAHMNLFEEAKCLQDAFSLLKDAVSCKISVIWPEVIHVNQLPTVSHQGERSCLTEATTNGVVWLAESLVIPRHRNECGWKLPDVYLNHTLAVMNHLNTSIVSLTLTVLLFAAIRLMQTQLSAETSKLPPFLGGFLGSNIFILLLTAVSNLEMEIFDDTFQARFFPEVVCCLFLGALAASTVHRISVTLW
ncbi:Elongator complex protein 1 [Trichuris trichiura]|uniref:Elongator complex protein 1 n=1 Tax=Trichuris trichiura TaxID=36087 RepID=A0A077Z9E6_TRITR|nr:Elongator complex protein 1 [Trichuris trichiura]